MEGAFLHLQEVRPLPDPIKLQEQQIQQDMDKSGAVGGGGGMWGWSEPDYNNARHRKKKNGSSSHRRPKYRDDGDDVSEVTVDTTLRDASKRHVEDIVEQMTSLKLELANYKADCDRAEWKHAQLLEKKQQQDIRVLVLEKENFKLKQSLKHLEKKYIQVSLAGTSSCSGTVPGSLAGIDNDAHSTEGASIAGMSIISGGAYSANPHRTIHEDDDEQGENVSVGWRASRSRASGSRASGDSSDDGSVLRGVRSPPLVAMVDLSSMHSIKNDYRGENGYPAENSDSELPDAGLEDVQVDEPREYTTNLMTATMYPDDDPFATMNPLGDDSVDQKAWWGWGKRPPKK